MLEREDPPRLLMALRRSLRQSLQHLCDSSRLLPSGIHADALFYSTCFSEPSSNSAHGVSRSIHRSSSRTVVPAFQTAWQRSPGLCSHLAARSLRCIHSQSACLGSLPRQRLPSLSEGLSGSLLLSTQQPPSLCPLPRSFGVGPAAVPELARYSVTVVTGTQRCTLYPCLCCHPDRAMQLVDRVLVCFKTWG